MLSSLNDSVLNIEGSLDIVSFGQGSRWTNATGTINLNGGEIHGRVFINDSLLQGLGSITSVVLNHGKTVSDGSTLLFDYPNFGGFDFATRGESRAELGDISSAHNSGGCQFFGGDMYVPDGACVREVLVTWRVDMFMDGVLNFFDVPTFLQPYSDGCP